MKETQMTYAPTDDCAIAPGFYPAHVSKFEAFESKSKEYKIFSLSYTLAKEAGKLSQPAYLRADNGGLDFDEEGNIKTLMDGGGEPIELSCQQFVGEEYNGAVFLNIAGGNNRSYFSALQALQIELKDKKVQGVMAKVLEEIEEKDVIGKPVLVKIGYDSYTNKKGEDRFSTKVLGIAKWDNGKALDPKEFEEALPF